MPFVSAMNTRNGQKVDLKQDLMKKKNDGWTFYHNTLRT